MIGLPVFFGQREYTPKGTPRKRICGLVHFLLVAGVVIFFTMLWNKLVPLTLTLSSYSMVLLLFIVLFIFPSFGIIGILQEWQLLLIFCMGYLLLGVASFMFLMVDVILSYWNGPVMLHGLANIFSGMPVGDSVALFGLAELLILFFMGVLWYDFCAVLWYYHEIGRKQETEEN